MCDQPMTKQLTIDFRPTTDTLQLIHRSCPEPDLEPGSLWFDDLGGELIVVIGPGPETYNVIANKTVRSFWSIVVSNDGLLKLRELGEAWFFPRAFTTPAKRLM